MSNPGDVTVIATLSIQNSANAAIIRAAEASGGFSTVADHATRDALPSNCTTLGTLVRTLNDGVVWEVVNVGPVVWAAWSGSGGVTSFKTRTGAVVPATGDYAASQLNNDSATVAGTHVSDALDNLKAGIAVLIPIGTVANWYVDSAGNDTTGDGLSLLTAFATPEKLSQTISPYFAKCVVQQSTTIHLTGLTTPGNLDLNVDAPGASSGFVLTIQADFTSSANITLNGVTNTVPSLTAAVRGRLTTAAGTFVDKARIRSTSGANVGAITYVTGLTSATDCFVKQWRPGTDSPFGGVINIANGTTVQVDQPRSALKFVNLKLGRGLGLIINDVWLTRGIHVDNQNGGSSIYLIQQCWLGSSGNGSKIQGNVQLINCTEVVGGTGVTTFDTAQPVFRGFVCLSVLANAYTSGLTLLDGCCFNGGVVTVGGQITTAISSFGLNGDVEWVNGNGQTAIALSPGVELGVTGIQFGFGTPYAVGALLHSNSQIVESSKLLAIPATQQLVVAGQNKNYADAPLFLGRANCGVLLDPDTSAVDLTPANTVPNWYVDGVSGSDANGDGQSLATAFQTPKRLQNTICPFGAYCELQQSTGIFFSRVTVADEFKLNVGAPVGTSFLLTIQGDFTSSADITLNTVVNTVLGATALTSTRGRLTTLSGTFVDKGRIRSTSGANVGAITYSTGLTSGTDTFVKTWNLPSGFGVVNIASGTTCKTDILTSCLNRVKINTDVNLGIRINDMRILRRCWIDNGGNGSATPGHFLQQCDLGQPGNNFTNRGNVQTVNCRWLSTTAGTASGFADDLQPILYGNMFLGPVGLVGSQTNVNFQSGNCFNGGTLTLGNANGFVSRFSASAGMDGQVEWVNSDPTATAITVAIGGRLGIAAQHTSFGTPYAIGVKLFSDAKIVLNSAASLLNIAATVQAATPNFNHAYADAPFYYDENSCGIQLNPDPAATIVGRPLKGQYHVDPTFVGVSNGSQSAPFPSHTAAIAASPSTGAVLIQAPLSTSTEALTLPTTGSWDIRSEHELAANIVGNLVCSGGNNLVAIDTMILTGTISGVASASRFLAIINSNITQAVSLTGTGPWSLMANAPGPSTATGTNGFFGNAVSVAGAILAQNYLFNGAITFTASSKFVGCRINTATINVGGAVLFLGTVFAVAPTFTGAAVVTMDGFSHASAIAAGGITLAGGATVVILNDVSPSGITPGSNTQVLTTVAGVTAWAAAAAGAVTSVFSRTGAIVALAGDYAASKINNDSATVAGTHVSDALDALKALIAASVTGVSSVYGRTGAVVAAVGDYAASKITNDSSTVTGAHVSDALDALKALCGVTSWNTRTGAISPVNGDYAASQVTNDSTVIGTGVSGAINTLKAQIAALVASSIGNDSSVTGTTVKDALNTLRTNLSALITGVSSVFGRTGAVTAHAGDYDSTQVNDASGWAGPTVRASLDLISSSVLGINNTINNLKASQVGNDSSVTGTTVKDALNALRTSLTGLTTSSISNVSNVLGGTGTLNAALNYLNDSSLSGDVMLPIVPVDTDGGAWVFLTGTGHVWTGNGLGFSFTGALGPVPINRVVTGVRLLIAPATGHAGMPTFKPKLEVRQIKVSGGILVDFLAGGASDPSLSVPAYETPHAIQVTGLSISTNDDGLLWVLTDESGSNKLPNLKIVALTVTLG